MYLIIDFEATCWTKDTDEGRRRTNRNENEIIEIGAVIVDDDFQVVSSIGIFVKPVFNPELSDFCKELTTITQNDVDNAEKLPFAWSKLVDFVKETADKEMSDLVFCSWGHYDRHQLKRDFKRHNMLFPFKYHVSLKHDFADRRHKRLGVSGALKLLGLNFDGTQHRGIDDARNIAKIFVKEWKRTGLTLREDHRCDA